jgi:hypothetical protein
MLEKPEDGAVEAHVVPLDVSTLPFEPTEDNPVPPFAALRAVDNPVTDGVFIPVVPSRTIVMIAPVFQE